MLLSPEFHSLYMRHYNVKKKKPLPKKKKRILSKILVHLSFLQLSLTFPIEREN